MRAIVASLVLLLMGACTPSEVFVCSDDSDCSGGGAGGLCESNGFCSFTDGQCSSGRRYGELSTGGVAGECISATGSADDVEPPPVESDDPVVDVPGTMTVECESGATVGALVAADDSAAFMGQAVDVPRDTAIFDDDAPQEALAPDRVEIPVEIPAAGTYYLWVRMLGRSSSSDTAYVGTSPFSLYRVTPSAIGTFQWVGTDTIAGQPMQAELEAGPTTVVVAASDASVSCDRIVVTDDPSYIPPGCSDCATVGIAITNTRSIADDAEENYLGIVDGEDDYVRLGAVSDSMGAPATLVGVRFRDANIPAGAIVKSAHIQFASDEINTSEASFEVSAELGDSGAFVDGPNQNLSGRAYTATAVPWSPPPWFVYDQTDDQRTPDLARVVQEVISSSGFARGDALTFAITGTGSRVAITRDAQIGGEPVLILEWRE